jgi:hypothetical protein
MKVPPFVVFSSEVSIWNLTAVSLPGLMPEREALKVMNLGLDRLTCPRASLISMILCVCTFPMNASSNQSANQPISQ